MYVNHNGRLIPANEPVLYAGNRAFRYGWGLFETMLVKDGSIRLGQYHWERLISGAAALGMQLPKLMDAAFFEKEVLRTVNKNSLMNLARVRLQLYNGNGGLLEREIAGPGFVIECFHIERHITELNEAGLVTGIATSARKVADNFSRLKTSNALIYAMAGREAKAAGWNDALLLNMAGNVIESTIANLFWMKSGIIHTPPLGDGCIAGVMRRHLLTKLPVHGIEVCQTTISTQELKNVENIFLTNAVQGLKWVRSFDNQYYTKGIIQEVAGHIF